MFTIVNEKEECAKIERLIRITRISEQVKKPKPGS